MRVKAGIHIRLIIRHVHCGTHQSEGEVLELMRTSHELLLKYRFDYRFELAEARVWYVDRGAPGNISVVNGEQILALESYYMEIRSEEKIKRIPYHRIRKIQYAGETVWIR